MKCLKTITTVFFLMTAIAAHAQGQVTSAMGKRKVLTAYADAGGTKEITQLNVADIAFPLNIFEVSDAGYVHVKISGQTIWLDRKQIRIPPESLEVSCLTVDRTNLNLQAGATRGANAGCK